MEFFVRHEFRNRIRIHIRQSHMSCEQADTLLYFLEKQEQVVSAKVYEKTCDVAVVYQGPRNELIRILKDFRYENVKVPATVIENSGRALNETYREKMLLKIALHYVSKWILPSPLRTCCTIFGAIKYMREGISCLWNRKLEVPVLDGTAIGVSVLHGDINTASSIMFMLGIGELLEEWTHKKSVDDLARSMSLDIGQIWVLRGGQRRQVSVSEIEQGDMVVVHMGTMIPFDGMVIEGEGMVNQASFTGEAVPVRKTIESYVYAGTVLEEGELTILVKEIGGSSRFDKIVRMIEESEKLKSGLESKAEHLADKLVPYSLGGTILTYFLTRNMTKALSILMVDFSCALKLAMPISVLSAIREAGTYHITVKGGKYLEAVADASTIVFDKTGTLTKARPTVVDVISFNGEDPDELLRIAACMEEHFPHSMAKAVVDAAKEKGLLHAEMHSKVEYVVAHGISTTIGEKKAVIGSYHFVFEDEGCTIDDGLRAQFAALPKERSYLYMAIEHKLAAVICIEDPLREEAANVIDSLRKTGFSKIAMMTGDSERTAAAIANKVGVDEYYAEVLPEDKAHYIEKEKSMGRKVIMIGDGINDSPALSAADVGIAISNGAEIAREIADITIGADDLLQLVTLKHLSDSLMRRIQKNYRNIVGFNTMLIMLGVGGVLSPATAALLHNTSTLVIGFKSMERLVLVDKSLQ